MVKCCTCLVTAMATFSLNVTIVLNAAVDPAAAASVLGNSIDSVSPRMEQNPAAATKPDSARLPPGGNPLRAIPIGSLSATRARPVFSASRRPPAPLPASVPVAQTPPPPAEPEHPPFTLTGTAIGTPRSVALLVDQMTRNVVRLHVGEAALGWVLRAVDFRSMTLEKNSQIVIVSLPARGTALASPAAVADASGFSRAF